MNRQWIYLCFLLFIIGLSDANGMSHKLARVINDDGQTVCSHYSNMALGIRANKCRDAKRVSQKSFPEVAELTVHRFRYIEAGSSDTQTYTGILCFKNPYLIVVRDSEDLEWCVSEPN